MAMLVVAPSGEVMTTSTCVSGARSARPTTEMRSSGPIRS